MALQVFDANSWVRRFIEADASGLPIRTLITNINTSPDVMVYVWDGRGGNERRRKMFPTYKANRTPPAENIFATMNLCKQAMRHSKALQITVEGYEGDDVIAALVGLYATKTGVTIWSTDRDLYALCTVEGVTHPTVTNPKCSPELTRLYKATVGDPSDAIPGIKGFGAKAWADCDKDSLRGWYEQGCPVLPSDPTMVVDYFGIPKACASWLSSNQELARTMWTIVGFMPPSAAEVEAGTIIGKRDDAAVATILGKYLQ